MKDLVKKSSVLLLCVVFTCKTINATTATITEFYKHTLSGKEVPLSICKELTMQMLSGINAPERKKDSSANPSKKEGILLTEKDLKRSAISGNISILRKINGIIVNNRFSASGEDNTAAELGVSIQKILEVYATTGGKEFQEKCKEALKRLSTLEEQRLPTKEVTKNNSSSSVGVSTTVATEHKNNSTSSIKNLTE